MTDTRAKVGDLRGLRGRFVTFEGIDGAGKSSQIAALAQRWREGGLDVVVTREPGGTPLAESIRALFLAQPMDGLTEALLAFAARRDHRLQQIEPALVRGSVVLCDRYTDATFAYQGGGRGVGEAVLSSLAHWVQEGREPDLTFWFDVDPRLAAQRRAQARAADRLEREDLEFFARVADAYRQRAQAAPERIVRIDANATPTAVAAQVLVVLEARGW